MQRIIFVSVMAVVALIGSAVAVRADAQDNADPLAGTTVEALGSVMPTSAPEHALVFLRITMEPGASIPAHSHPGGVVLVVESGSFGTEFVQGSGTITRATTPGTPAATEESPAGAEAILEAGDSVAYDQDAAHTMRNAGEEPLVLLVSALLAADEPGFLFLEAGTPAP
ncbi:MAG: cupin domain-containing protein [Thermomicrobiales bacterium]